MSIAGLMLMLLPLYADSARREHIPAPLLRALCAVESSNRPHVVNWHDNGGPAIGLCQLKLATARMMGFGGTLEQLLYPSVNIAYAAKYLAYQYKACGQNWPKAVVAYNRGVCTGNRGSKYWLKVQDELRKDKWGSR